VKAMRILELLILGVFGFIFGVVASVFLCHEVFSLIAYAFGKKEYLYYAFIVPLISYPLTGGLGAWGFVALGKKLMVKSKESRDGTKPPSDGNV
jgi:hypothetical protein